MVSMALPAQRPGHAGQRDNFSSTLWKLWTLLDLATSHRVLFVGDTVLAASSSREDLGPAVERCANASAVGASSVPYDLIVWGPPFDRFDQDVRTVARSLAPGGRLLLFAPNRLSLFRGRHSARALLDRHLRTLAGYREALSKAGVHVNECWLPWPTLEGAEEYMAAEEPKEMRMSAGVRSYFAARVRAISHDGHVILASRTDRASGMGERIARAVGAFLGVQGPPRVTRFDLRQRGALVLLLKDAGSDQGWVGRVCRHSEVAAHLEANERIVKQLRDATTSHAQVQRFLPRPLGRLEVEGAVAWLEDRLPGTVAWRLPQRLRGVIDRGWMQFLADLEKVEATRVDLDEHRATELVQRWRRGTRLLPEQLDAEVSPLEDWLLRKLAGTSRRLGWSHGDFGYGNLLADRESGCLQAVIDWETGRSDEMVGIDWMNMLLVGERMGGDLPAAVLGVAHRMKDRGSADEPARGLAASIEETGIGCSADELLGLALLRIVQREARYPSLLAESAPEFTAALRAFRTIAGY
jgi:hypothetical protein